MNLRHVSSSPVSGWQSTNAHGRPTAHIDGSRHDALDCAHHQLDADGGGHITLEEHVPPPAPSLVTPVPTLPAASADTPQIVLTRGPGAGAVFPVPPGTTTLGRDRECDIVLDHTTVSRHHATLHRPDHSDPGTLADSTSLNGTHLNGEPIDHTTLTDGDEIRIGVFHLVFHAPTPSDTGTPRPRDDGDPAEVIEHAVAGPTRR